MPKNKTPRIITDTRPRGSLISDITSTVNQLKNGTSTLSEEAQVLEYYSLLAEARASTDQAVDQQPQKPADPKRRSGERGRGYTLRHRMELVEIFRYLKRTGVKVTTGNFHQFVHRPISRKSIAQWDKDFDKIWFGVAHGRGDKCTLSSSPVDLIRHIMDKTVLEWLLEVRKSNGVVSSLQLQVPADSVLHILADDIIADDICDCNDIPHGRTISFTTSWRSRMTQEYGVAYCSLRGEAGSVDKDAITERMNEIRNICADFEPDDIYTCAETGMYLRELSTHSYTTEEFMSGGTPKRGKSRVSILFCVNASGSSLDRAEVVKALRPQVLSEHLARGIQPLPEVPIASTRHEHGYNTLDLFKQWLHLLDESLTNKSVLLIDSCGAHGKSGGKDPLAGEIWKQLRIERLPPNSASVTQPLDAGIISAFKRHYLEMLSNKSITKEYATGERISNDEAWSLIPYAWSHVKALAVRHCFCKVGVLSKAQVDKLEQESVHLKERSPLYPPVADTDASQARRRYVRLIASVTDGDKIQFSLDKNQKDAEDMAEEIKQKMRKKIAKRYGTRDRSSSIEHNAIESFKSREAETVKTKLLETLRDEDASHRKMARLIIRSLCDP